MKKDIQILSDELTESSKKRFWLKVDRQAECWTWNSCRIPSGYGRFNLNGVVVYAHRLSYVMANGPIIEGMQIDHLCRNPLCVNPAHLEAVTPRENVRRSASPAAINHLKTHCPEGHPLIAGNIYTKKNGIGRKCRRCAIDKAVLRQRRLRNKRTMGEISVGDM